MNQQIINDEITEACFTVEPAEMVRVPLIAECSINLEHRLEWHRSLYEKSNCHLFEGRVVHLVVDDRVMVTNPIQRMRSMDLM